MNEDEKKNLFLRYYDKIKYPYFNSFYKSNKQNILQKIYNNKVKINFSGVKVKSNKKGKFI